MDRKELIVQASSQIDGSGLQDHKATLAFVMSLLPIPGLQQAATVATRALDSKILKAQIEEIDRKLQATEDQAKTASSTAQEALRIATAAKQNSELKAAFVNLAENIENEILNDQTEFVMETRNWSYQELIESPVEADIAEFIADNHSENVIRDSEVTAKSTKLKADDHSVNRIHNTTFKGKDGSVGMKGIAQKGNVGVEDSSLTFGPGGGAIIFETPLSAPCSLCNEIIRVQRAELAGKSQIKCPHCGGILNIQ